jgi:uncharacterized protein (TIGR02452 family)
MNEKALRIKWAHETLASFMNKSYTNNLGSKVQLLFNEHNSTHISEESSDDIMGRYTPITNNYDTEFSVVNQATIEAGHDLSQDFGTTVMLNFASGKSPGGGFLKGSQAQEESLCRSSNLFLGLMQSTLFYTNNVNIASAMHCDDMVLSEVVTFIRQTNGELYDSPFDCAVLTCPAVNAGLVEKYEKDNISEIYTVMDRRIEKVLAMAAIHQYDNLVLGAWGCGVFKCDPSIIASLFNKHLNDGKYQGVFKKVRFAIYEDSQVESEFKQFFKTESLV